MPSQIAELKRCLLIHLKKNPRERLSIESPDADLRKCLCENFSFLYEDQKPESRCLLGEYHNEQGERYFDDEEIIQMCPNFRLEKGNKCQSNGQLPHTEDQDVTRILKKYQEIYRARIP